MVRSRLAVTSAFRLGPAEYGAAISRHDLPEAWPWFSPKRGSRECRMRAAPAVSCAMCTRKCAHEHKGTAGALRHSLRKGVYGDKKYRFQCDAAVVFTFVSRSAFDLAAEKYMNAYRALWIASAVDGLCCCWRYRCDPLETYARL